MLALANYYFLHQELCLFVCLQARKKLHNAPLNYAVLGPLKLKGTVLEKSLSLMLKKVWEPSLKVLHDWFNTMNRQSTLPSSYYIVLKVLAHIIQHMC